MKFAVNFICFVIFVCFAFSLQHDRPYIQQGIAMNGKSIHPLLIPLFIAVLVLSLILPGNSAESAPGIAPAIGRILDRYTQALGGETMARGIVSIVAEGVFYFPESQMRGMVRQVLKAPNKSVFTIKSQDKEIFIEM